ncbi:MAG: MBL fold metallo-hydrolase [Geminicoccaceae bacterium]
MAEVTIRVLGCGDAFGSGGRFQTCFHFRAGKNSLLIDCGATALVAMRRLGIEPNVVDTILVSHLHGDHFAGIPFFLLDAQFVTRRRRPLIIAGPGGTHERILRALEVLFPGSTGMDWRFPLRFTKLEPGRTEGIGRVRVTPFEVRHPSGAPSLALRLACQGKVLAYSGDTEWTKALVEVSRDADLFIVECYGYSPKAGFHLDFQTLLGHRRELGAKRVLLTHMSEEMLGKLDGLDVEAAEDGMRISL